MRGGAGKLNASKDFAISERPFCDDELTSGFVKLDETNLPRYPMGWQEWLDQMFAEISYDEAQQELIFFVGEADYQQNYQIVVLRPFCKKESLVSQRL